jgi:hypothetical protein
MPLVLELADKPDFQIYEEAMRGHELLKSAYDPETQTSNIPSYAGTSLTYATTYTGSVVSSSDTDQRRDDT